MLNKHVWSDWGLEKRKKEGGKGKEKGDGEMMRKKGSEEQEEKEERRNRKQCELSGCKSLRQLSLSPLRL